MSRTNVSTDISDEEENRTLTIGGSRLRLIVLCRVDKTITALKKTKQKNLHTKQWTHLIYKNTNFFNMQNKNKNKNKPFMRGFELPKNTREITEVYNI